MTPCDLVGMAALNGLELIALTDHNTARNCPAAARAAEAYGIGFIAGMEVTTSEEIHAVCLFPCVEAALEFDGFIYQRLMKVPNRPEIFGRQVLCGDDGRHRRHNGGCPVA
jgi:predicted metal-dependent phosphoesterase TrpH